MDMMASMTCKQDHVSKPSCQQNNRAEQQRWFCALRAFQQRMCSMCRMCIHNVGATWCCWLLSDASLSTPISAQVTLVGALLSACQSFT